MTQDEIRDISVKAYCARLEAENGKGAIQRVINKDEDGGKKLRNRAGAYDALTRVYLQILAPELVAKQPKLKQIAE